MFVKKLIIFLIRKRMHLKRNERFRFDNQRSKKDYYYFTATRLVKIEYEGDLCHSIPAHVSINWLLDDECKIHLVGDE